MSKFMTAGLFPLRKCMVGVIAFGLVHAAFAGPKASGASSAQSNEGPIRISFETNDTGLPTVVVKINGVPVTLFLDYGGYAQLAVKSEALGLTAVRFTSDVQRSRDAQGRDRVSRKFTAQTLSVGSRNWQDVSGTELPASPAFRFPQSGYLGFGILKSYLAVFDYAGNELRLYPPGDRKALVRECGSSTFPISVVDGVTQTTAKTWYGERTFQFDTGSNMDLLRPASVPGEPPKPGTQVELKSFQLGRGGDFRRCCIAESILA
ncbi:MAG TPA: hypothetical protein VK519_03810 [Pinirhizobacter sp.]|uniref:hypothetical protein n=1 Tax=Pinirhizobacter sp. TaxID=2950432 RepID=UPI002B79AA5A|nr:hypothetical protein [Pinirhizobacter sp.]HMH67027.1 hypothetical protein [Pinirhizobacter sp.]